MKMNLMHWQISMMTISDLLWLTFGGLSVQTQHTLRVWEHPEYTEVIDDTNVRDAERDSEGGTG